MHGKSIIINKLNGIAILWYIKQNVTVISLLAVIVQGGQQMRGH